MQDICLRHILLLLHPFTPFISEELWFLLGFSNGQSIQDVTPGTGGELLQKIGIGGLTLDKKVLDEMDQIRDLVTSMRSLKAERNLSNNRNVAFSFFSDDLKADVLLRNKESILTTVGAAELNRVNSQIDGMPAIVTPLGSVYLDLSTGVDLKAERSKLEKDLIHLEKVINSLKAKLSNNDFTNKAPQEVVEGARHQLLENEAKLNETKDALRAMS